MKHSLVDPDALEAVDIVGLLRAAWEVRNQAFVIGPTRVGCAVLAEGGSVFAGCNVEHRYRSHDVHAEVNAITSMVAQGQVRVLAVAIAAERERFTPCGACMDWIMQFGGAECLVVAQSSPEGDYLAYKASDLMPFYPR